MTHIKLHQFCKQEKEQAMRRAESSDSQIKYDSCQAVTAWDELAGQLHKPTTVKRKRFEKAKQTALRIIALCSDSDYREEQEQRIKDLKL